MASKFPFIKREKGGKVVLDAYEMEILISEDYFSNGIASLIGDKLNTIGIFRFRIKQTESSPKHDYLLNLPSPILISFQDSFSSKEKIDGVEERFKIFRLEKGDIFMESETIVASPKNVEAFANLLHAGKVPKTTYESIYRQYIQVQEDNKTPLGVPSSTIEATIAELCRSIKNEEIPFRIALNRGGALTDFKLVTLRSLPALISTFSGISFENINAALASGVARKRKGKEEEITPMEKTVFF
jgi:hypothetical protein